VQVDTTTTYSAGALWFALLFVNAALAAALDRPRLPYFLWSIIFGPFVTMFLAIAGKKTAL